MFEIGEIIEFEIDEWFAKKEELDTTFIEGIVVTLTQKAVLIELADGDEMWFPLSVIN